ncbi:hypothetical protein SZN_31134, partial [Streptomyces zinciresistens K42]
MQLLPALAGMDPTCGNLGGRARTAPRARGDGPVDVAVAPVAVDCSPRSRGWTLLPLRQGVVDDLLPALAGMDPYPLGEIGGSHTAPRARGDGPRDALASLGVGLLPALAGMDPP